MSYVIQNFNKINYNLTLTPRIKFIVFLKNKYIVFYLIKFFYKIFNYKYCDVYYVFYSHFFKNILFKLKQLVSILNLNYYKNRFSVSLVYWNLNYIYNFKNIIPNSRFISDFSFKTRYLSSIKTLSNYFKNKFYKILFFNLIFNFFLLWPDFNINFNFKLSFFFINYNLQIFKFFNGPFFKIYNS